MQFGYFQLKTCSQFVNVTLNELGNKTSETLTPQNALRLSPGENILTNRKFATTLITTIILLLLYYYYYTITNTNIILRRYPRLLTFFSSLTFGFAFLHGFVKAQTCAKAKFQSKSQAKSLGPNGYKFTNFSLRYRLLIDFVDF